MNFEQIKMYIHAFFSTKDVVPLISQTLEESLYYRIIFKITQEFKSKVININGTEDHVHILFNLNPVFNLSDFLRNVKGETSHWINHEELTDKKFAWQKSYFAYSVSERDLKKVSRYIDIQKEYHKQYSFLDECNFFLKNGGCN
ncbi:MAG TPA: IS200/IS605 family transposase [Ignavibacteria bacterium]|nr:IS200/IS605 family transposase [Ignavibacteria bacterium]